MGALSLHNYDDSFNEEYIEFAQWQFYNYHDGESFVDDEGVRWNVTVNESAGVKRAILDTQSNVHFTTYSTAKLHSKHLSPYPFH